MGGGGSVSIDADASTVLRLSGTAGDFDVVETYSGLEEIPFAPSSDEDYGTPPESVESDQDDDDGE